MTPTSEWRPISAVSHRAFPLVPAPPLCDQDPQNKAGRHAGEAIDGQLGEGPCELEALYHVTVSVKQA